MKLRNISRYVIISVIIGSSLYLALFLYAYRGNLLIFIESFSGGNSQAIILAALARVAVLSLHGITWWVLMRSFRRVSLGKVIRITYVSVFTEFLIPIGGITEVVKVTLASRLKVLGDAEAISSLFAHRIVLSLSMATAATIALILLKAPSVLYIFLLGPSGVLVAVNVVGFLIPSSKRVESTVNKFLTRFGYRVEDFSTRYYECVKVISSKPLLIVLAYILELIQRLINAVFGVFIASSLGVSIGLMNALLAFDSLYAIMWLLPVVTPGGLGIYEAIQTSLLSFLGISVNQAASMSIMTRVIYLLVGYTLFAYSTMTLGVRFKSLVERLSPKLK